MRKSKTHKAMDTLREALKDSPSYAHGWHCNLAMAFYDAWGPVITDSDEHKEQLRIIEDGASRFMKLCFDVETNNDIYRNQKTMIRDMKSKTLQFAITFYLYVFPFIVTFFAILAGAYIVGFLPLNLNGWF